MPCLGALGAAFGTCPLLLSLEEHEFRIKDHKQTKGPSSFISPTSSTTLVRQFIFITIFEPLHWTRFPSIASAISRRHLVMLVEYKIKRPISSITSITGPIRQLRADILLRPWSQGQNSEYGFRLIFVLQVLQQMYVANETSTDDSNLENTPPGTVVCRCIAVVLSSLPYLESGCRCSIPFPFIVLPMGDAPCNQLIAIEYI